MTSDAVRQFGIVGGGLGGLGAAVTLAGRGHNVTVFEQNVFLGGKAASLVSDGFRFDMGPTILTVPSTLRRIFSEAGHDVEDWLNMIRLDPQWRCFYEDGTTLDLVQNIDEMAERIAKFSGEKADATGYRNFQKLAKQLAEISSRTFLWKDIGSVRDTLDWHSALRPGTLNDVRNMRLGQSVASTIRSYVGDERLAQMMDHFTQYVGSAPDQSPAVLCSIAHLQRSEGVWYPSGGIRAVPDALVGLAKELGVTLKTETSIKRVVVERGRAVGVLTGDGQRYAFDAIISNSDTVRTHRELLDGKYWKAFSRNRTLEPACSGVVLYLGLSKTYEHLTHHNFVFSRNPDEEFEIIYRQGEPAPDPTCYVCAPSRTDPSVAPTGGEALYILVHTPYLRARHDWEEMASTYRKVIFDKLERTAGLIDLELRISYEEMLTPVDIRDRYRTLDGAIYGLASHGKYFGAFKPPNRSREVGGLYFAGGSAHPGPGMPMALMSGWIAADCADRDLGQATRGLTSSNAANISGQ